MAWLTILGWALDVTLALLLLWLAWRALEDPRLFRSIIVFIAFGLVLGLAWARLGAIDIALAEMAIGSGVTGALLLAALARLRQHARGRQPRSGGPDGDS